MKLFYTCRLALLCLIGCITVFGASGDVSIPVPDALKSNSERIDRSWKRYRNPNLGYCVNYPSRWLRDTAFEGSGLILETGLRRYSKPTGEIDIGPINVATEDDARIQPALLSDDLLAQNLQDHLAGLQKFARAERMEIIDQRPMNLQGKKALYLKNSYYDPLERTSWMEEVVFINHKGESYRLEMHCPPDQVKRFEPVFAYLVSSLEFDCK